MADRCSVSARVVLHADWIASLVGHDDQYDMAAKLRRSLLGDVDEVTTLPNVRVLDVEITTTDLS